MKDKMKRKRYTVIVKRSAEKSIARFPKNIGERVLDAIERLANNPRPPGCKKLEDDYWRIWIGRRYRVIYKIDDKQRTVTVVIAKTREGAY